MLTKNILTFIEESKPKFKKRGGFIGSGKNITTKHDSTICSRRNAERFLENVFIHIDLIHLIHLWMILL